MSPTVRPVCVHKELSCASRLDFTRTKPWGESAEVSQNTQKSVLDVKLINGIASSRTQQPDFSSIVWGRVIPAGRAIDSPQADDIQRRVL